MDIPAIDLEALHTRASRSAGIEGAAVERISYRGWQDCYRIANGCAEAIVVPSIGRVMQLRLAGDPIGTFWEHRALYGQLHNAADGEWLNFGGDKCWPAPQAGWPLHQGHGWPPPAAFDSCSVEAIAAPRGVVLTSPIDPVLGIQAVRHIELDAERAVMRIRTEFRKLDGDPVTAGIWTITQMQEPERIVALLPIKPRFDNGYIRLMESGPANLHRDGRLLLLARHRSQCVKIGTEAFSLLWVGRTCVVRIDAETGPGEYPDGGCKTEIYTNPDPLEYVELETLGPLATLCAGERIERTTVYTVMPRVTCDPETDARQIFELLTESSEPIR